MTKTFACKPNWPEPPDLTSPWASGSPGAVRTSKLATGLQQRSAIPKVTGMNDRHVGRSKRIGQNTDANAAIAQPPDERHLRLARDEIGRDDDELALRAFDGLRDSLPHEPPRLAVALDLRLVGRIVGQRRLGPDERLLPGQDVCQDVAGRKRAHVIRGGHLFLVRGERLAAAVEIGLRRLAERKRLDRYRELVVPVDVEAVGQGTHRRAGDDEVEVAEVDDRARLEVLVADVAAARYRDRVVADKSLLCIR